MAGISLRAYAKQNGISYRQARKQLGREAYEKTPKGVERKVRRADRFARAVDLLVTEDPKYKDLNTAQARKLARSFLRKNHMNFPTVASTAVRRQNGQYRKFTKKQADAAIRFYNYVSEKVWTPEHAHRSLYGELISWLENQFGVTGMEPLVPGTNPNV